MTRYNRLYDLTGSPDGYGPQFFDTQDGDTGDPATFDSFRTTAAAPASGTLTDALYLQEPGDTSAISVADINQGQIGDCFLLSSIGELALFHPASIISMIHPNSNGTETVTLHEASNGTLPGFGTTSFASVSVTVTNSFPNNAVNNGANQDVSGNSKEIWAQVLEKAVATLDGGYNAIANGGSPVLAMEELTGDPATYMSPAALTLANLDQFVAAGDLIAMDTSSAAGLPFNLVSNHAYMFEGVTMQGGVPMLTLGNPWGTDQPAVIPLSQLALGIIEVDVCHVA
nr:C2 family cysteine protease [uncultured Rhodopila sp.]